MYRLVERTKKKYWDYVYLIPDSRFLHIKTKNSSHAIGAFCTLCGVPLKYSKGSTYAISRHVATFHPEETTSPTVEFGASDSKTYQPLFEPLQLLGDSCIAGKRPPLLKKISKEQQATIRRLIAAWLGSSQRPYSLVEDEGFVRLLAFVGSLGEIQVKLDSRTTITNEVKKLASEIRDNLRERIAAEARYYSITTDVWTDRAMRSYNALTVHYISPQFEMNSWVLEVMPFEGKHTGDAIRNSLVKALRFWRLKLSRCVRLVRDGAKNAKKAANALGVPHFSCIAHSLHLVVASALIKKKGKCTDATVVAALEAEEQEQSPPSSTLAQQLIDGAEFESTSHSPPQEAEVNADVRDSVLRLQEDVCDRVDRRSKKLLTADELMEVENVRQTVQVFRSLAVYFNKSAKGSFRIRSIVPDANPKSKAVGFDTDCPTRWNSTFTMLSRFVELEETVRRFFTYITQHPDGREEFKGVTLRQPNSEEWATIKLLLVLLYPFALATDELEGNSTPTLTLAYPFLCCIKDDLNDETLFDKQSQMWRHESFYDSIQRKMHTVRKGMAKLFHERFRNIKDDVLWISMLDPRVSTTPHLTLDERHGAVNALMDAAMRMAQDVYKNQAHSVDVHDRTARGTPVQPRHKYVSKIYNDGQTSGMPAQEAAELHHSALQAKCREELDWYLVHTKKVTSSDDPLLWWRLNCTKLPVLAGLARKWLSCVATSAPSERAFSTGGSIVTAKRCSLTPENVRDSVFLSENLYFDEHKKKQKDKHRENLRKKRARTARTNEERSSEDHGSRPTDVAQPSN